MKRNVCQHAVVQFEFFFGIHLRVTFHKVLARLWKIVPAIVLLVPVIEEYSGRPNCFRNEYIASCGGTRDGYKINNALSWEKFSFTRDDRGYTSKS